MIRGYLDGTGSQVTHIRDAGSYGGGARDEDWIAQLGSAGDWVVISGDTRIARTKHLRELWRKTKLIGFFWAPGWLSMRFEDQAWRLVRVWPNLNQMALNVAASSIFEVPVRSTKFRPL